MTPVDPNPAGQDGLAADSSNFELLKTRLAARGSALQAAAQALNEARLEAFGRAEQALVRRIRARTENNCVARDIVRIGELLLFGYNVFIGLRKETAVSDVFALYRLGGGEGDELEAVPLAGSFLDDMRFTADFRELHTYYKQATLTQLRVLPDKLLAAFRIGQQLHDIRVFRWSIARDGTLSYLDNRGERDIALPPSHDFEWTVTTREDHIGGRHPHVNIDDTVFVETIGGDLTIKVENNTESGLGIYAEPVEDKNQALADAEIAWARLGSLILLKIRPYREQDTRYLVYNARVAQVQRIDAIGRACIQLPEDHGIIFPGGYYLQSGESKLFDLPRELVGGLAFKRSIRAPNGEDVLYIFYEPASGHYVLLAYALIDKQLAPPIVCNGYARFDDGRILVFVAEGEEPTRVHPMQLWQTPFASEDHAAAQPRGEGFLARVGNAELVRALSEVFGVSRAVSEQAATRAAYEALIRQCGKTLDAYFWLADPEADGMAAALRGVGEIARATLDEFDKVAAIRRDSARALEAAEQQQRALLTDVASCTWRRPDDFVQALQRLTRARGELRALAALRYMDVARVTQLETALAEAQQRVGEKALGFLAADDAFTSQHAALAEAGARIDAAATSGALDTLLAELDQSASGLDLLTEQLGSLPGGDANTRTRILDAITTIFGDINRLRAGARQRRKQLGANEAAAEFGAQFRLFGQSVDHALDFADTPEKCDESLTRLLAQLEELEGRFAEQEGFLAEITARRESLYEAFVSRRQSLLEGRQRRVQGLADAARRILEGVPRRVAQLASQADTHAYFATDPLLAKLERQIAEVRQLGNGVLADELATALASARDQAVRAVRDRQELQVGGADGLRLGRHVFTINRQALDLSLVLRDGRPNFHLTGTDYYAALADGRLDALQAWWPQLLPSESARLYRGEFLAGRFIEAVEQGQCAWSWEALQQHCLGDLAVLTEAVRQFAAPRYTEAYQKGVHDADAARIVQVLVPMQAEAGALSWGPSERALARLFWRFGMLDGTRDSLGRRARAVVQMRSLYAQGEAARALECELAQLLARFAQDFPFVPAGPVTDEAGMASLAAQAARYLVDALGAPQPRWVLAGVAEDLATHFTRALEQDGRLSAWREDLAAAAPQEAWGLAQSWLSAFATHRGEDAGWVDDAACALLLDLPHARINAGVVAALAGLLGDHPRLPEGALTLNLHDFWRRYHHHVQHDLPAFEALQRLRQTLIAEEKARLRLSAFQAQPLSSFVRNALIDQVYLPIVGDNLAKQLGTAGDERRTDRMGMLMLISPPGYGKTTLMEYLAERLGLIFVRINCPAIGHGVTALDPAAATSGAARQELEKLNLGLLMGNNVMLYLDDIQHTHPEFLQKFIALADGTRRIEAVWRGEVHTCDLRGKRFALVMAGNPYTESGEVFKIPDMLANRADIYNLGDVLAGREAVFAQSYIENALTAHPLLQPLTSRDPGDVGRLLQLARGEEVPGSAFAHAYSRVELDELVALLQRLFRVRDVLLRVNAAYIASAAQQDAYRTEPPFKLQGSYRNMAKLVARVTPLSEEAELDALLRDHYRGEAQTLTTGAEENLLKLAQLLGRPSADEDARWQTICEEFRRRAALGGEDSDGLTRIALSLQHLVGSVQQAGSASPLAEALPAALARIEARLAALQPDIRVAAPDTSEMAAVVREIGASFDKVLMPLVTATYHKMRLDHSLWDEMKKVSKLVEKIEKTLP